MPIWEVECPNCGTVNRVDKDSVVVECGVATCTVVCTHCSEEFTEEQEYWRWLGLERDPDDIPGKSAE